MLTGCQIFWLIDYTKMANLREVWIEKKAVTSAGKICLLAIAAAGKLLYSVAEVFLLWY